MKISVDISYYPLKEEFKPQIIGFIDRLNTYKDLTAQTNGMSTQVFGEYKYVMNALTTEIEKAFENPHSVFVMKLVNADLQVVEKW
jgi:uncharacterized protein YqgV (UPF0045/DUF77 family)